MADSFFRGRLDDPAGWECWQLTPDERAALGARHAAAGAAAAARLKELFGRAGAQFGGTNLADAIGRMPTNDNHAFALGRALVALDCFTARATPSRPQPGGMTNPRNRRRWAKLQRHMLARIDAALTAEAAGMILSQCVFAYVPAERVPAAPFERSLAAALACSDSFGAVGVTLDLDQEPRGGLHWLDVQSRETLAAVETALNARRPCLLELLRAPGQPPSNSEIVVVFASDDTGNATGTTRLRVWDPASGRERRLDVAPQADGRPRFTEPAAPDAATGVTDQPSVKAIRLWQVAPAVPPLHGLRRLLPWPPPWRAAWWLRRWIAVRLLDGAIGSTLQIGSTPQASR